VITIYNGQAVVKDSKLNHILMKIPILLYISVIIAIISSPPISAESVPKIGKTCPQGYHIDGSSGYCIPFDVKNAQRMVPKIGKTCPTGYHIDGARGYCALFSNTKQKDLIPKIGKTCLAGYHIDGESGYCTPF
jgi:hypothetical protein